MDKKNRQELVSLLNTKVMEKALEIDKEEHSGHQRVITRLWPTEASAVTPNKVVGRCRRSVYYSQIAAVGSDVDWNGLARMSCGKLLETWLTQLVKQGGVYHDNSIKISFPAPSNPSLTISGEVDIIYQLDDEVVGGEIKSSYGYTFSNTVFHKKTIPGMPKVEHLMQTLLYLHYYKYVDTQLGITRFILTYIDRGSMDIIHHIVELGDDGIPVVNGIKLTGINDYSNPIFDVPGINTQKTHDKLINYQITMRNIFDRYNSIYEHLESGLLIERDYNPLWDQQTIVRKAATSELSKSRYKDYQDGKIPFLCDTQCGWCGYRDACMKDDGINP